MDEPIKSRYLLFALIDRFTQICMQHILLSLLVVGLYIIDPYRRGTFLVVLGCELTLIQDSVWISEISFPYYSALLTLRTAEGCVFPYLEFFVGDFSRLELRLLCFEVFLVADVFVSCNFQAYNPGVEANQVRV